MGAQGGFWGGVLKFVRLRVAGGGKRMWGCWGDLGGRFVEGQGSLGGFVGF